MFDLLLFFDEGLALDPDFTRVNKAFDLFDVVKDVLRDLLVETDRPEGHLVELCLQNLGH